MAIVLHLAMTAAEFTACSPLPGHIAWMACHFSPYGTGITNLPKHLPPGSLLILNDRTPVCGHDPALVAQTLDTLVKRLKCGGILLDFQRPGCEQTNRIAAEIAKLPCPVAVSELYAGALDCPVFLPPVPLHQPLADHLAPWQGREVWLEAALDSLQITVTEKGSEYTPLPWEAEPEIRFTDGCLHCGYTTTIQPGLARFSLHRTRPMLNSLLTEAEKLGVTHAVGLYQQLRRK